MGRTAPPSSGGRSGGRGGGGRRNMSSPGGGRGGNAPYRGGASSSSRGGGGRKKHSPPPPSFDSRPPFTKGKDTDLGKLNPNRRRKKRPNRNPPRNRAESISSLSSVKKKGPPPLQLPHVKVTVRRISDVEKYGSDSKMVDLIRALCDGAPGVTLDEKSLAKCYLDMDENGETKDGETKDGETKDGETKDGETKDGETKDGETKDGEPKDGKPFKDSNPTNPDSNPAKDPDPTKDNPKSEEEPSPDLKPLTTARLLYLTSPRKSRRRGIITGTIYLILIPPPPSKPCHTSNDRSRAVASAKIILETAREQLSQSASALNCVAELSSSQKTWKEYENNGRRRDHRYEGTIEASEDFHQFLDGLEKPREVPKEEPETEKTEEEEKIAAVLKYLQEKREEAKVKQATKQAAKSRVAAGAPPKRGMKLLEKSAGRVSETGRKKEERGKKEKVSERKKIKKEKKKRKEKKKDVMNSVVTGIVTPGTPVVLLPPQAENINGEKDEKNGGNRGRKKSRKPSTSSSGRGSCAGGARGSTKPRNLNEGAVKPDTAQEQHAAPKFS